MHVCSKMYKKQATEDAKNIKRRSSRSQSTNIRCISERKASTLIRKKLFLFPFSVSESAECCGVLCTCELITHQTKGSCTVVFHSIHRFIQSCEMQKHWRAAASWQFCRSSCVSVNLCNVHTVQQYVLLAQTTSTTTTTKNIYFFIEILFSRSSSILSSLSHSGQQ